MWWSSCTTLRRSVPSDRSGTPWLLFAAATALISSCSEIQPGICDESRQLLFQTGFSSSTVVARNSTQDIVQGIDPDFTDHNEWSAIAENEYIDDVFIN